ncbi:MAG: hypothetical protein H7Y06_13105 [Opitutaceae bacterium]|nr:hypothetical protein [Opitutaceae bacterium]
MNIPRSIRLLVPSLVALIATGALHADWKDDVGYTRLQQTFPSEAPVSPAGGVTQAEAPDGSANYAPDTASPLFTGNTFDLKSGASGANGHAHAVASYFYGNTSSLLSSPLPVDLYNANNWLGSGFLNYGQSAAPASENRRVQNHSWISMFDTSQATTSQINSAVTNINQRLDFAIDRDGFTSVVGMGNGASTTLPDLLGQSYHSLSVGLVNGSHSAGLTAWDGAGRMKPDLVAFEGVTSYSTPQVASAAALISEKIRNTPYSPALSTADYPRLTKALLLAGAAKEPLPFWSRPDTTKPYDSVYGAGALNVFLSHRILIAGQQPAHPSGTVAETGWDVNTANSTRLYFFDIPSGGTSTHFSAALSWHRSLIFFAGSFFGPALTNLDLKLFTATGTTLGTQIDASLSTVDNVEHLYQATLAPGRYALQVSLTNGSATPYALAWRTSPSVSVADTTSVAREADTSPAVFTVTRTGSTTSPLYVPLSWSGTAVSGTHYLNPPNAILIPAGASSSTLPITPVSDNLAQGDRTITLSVATDFSLSAGSAASATVTLQDKPFDAWRFTRFTTEELADSAISGDSADPDADGISNLLEYALGTEPKSPDTSTRLPTPAIDNDRLTLTYTRPTTNTDLTYTLEWSDNLSTWHTGPEFTELISSTDNGNGTITVFTRALAPLSTAPRQFLRLRVTR